MLVNIDLITIFALQWWLGRCISLLGRRAEWPRKGNRCTLPAAHTSAGWAATRIFQEEMTKISHKAFYCVSDTGYCSQHSESYPEDRTSLPINGEKMSSLFAQSQNVTVEMQRFIQKELWYQPKYKKDIANVCCRKDNTIKTKHFRALGPNWIHGNWKIMGLGKNMIFQQMTENNIFLLFMKHKF